ncbi:MAG: UDP-glucose/GDP-mannose dehydrogenase family protein [bacterium]|nr:UDP-glucose/GDP-mannose dehydrogenase family protein [bacterium]
MKNQSSHITVIGAGYVGLITAVAFAKFGHRVTCIDIDGKKIAKLRRGVVPIHEPGVKELLKKGLAEKHLFFTTHYEDAFAVHHPQFVFLCVGTPPRRNGSADLSYLEDAARAIARHMTRPTAIIIKSTVPVGTGRQIQRVMSRFTKMPCTLVSNPEFLREGKALYDFMYPDKIVIGSDDKKTLDEVSRLYAVFKKPIFKTTLETSELAKYAQNAFLATEISFVNTLAELAERCNADVRTIVASLKLDKRIGPNAYLAPGPGYGGSCFPKDVKALIHFGKKAGVHAPVLLESVERVNNKRPGAMIKKAESMLGSCKGKRVTFLGIAFKAGTDDVRFSPAVALARAFISRGAKLSIYDPMALGGAQKVLGTQVSYARNAYGALKSSELLVLATEWPEFGRLEFGHIKRIMKTPNILDVRNFLPAEKLQNLGFNYLGVGIPYLRGMHASWLKILAKDARKLKKLSTHELRQLKEGLEVLGEQSQLIPELQEV